MRTGDRATLRLYLEEVARIAGHGRHMAFFASAAGSLPAPGPLPVLLLHGVLCNRGSMDDLRASSARAAFTRFTR
jgi:hypothetical protein